MNVTHTINQLWFGRNLELHKIQEAAVFPLKGTSKSASEVSEEGSASFEYYLKVVPSSYEPLAGGTYDCFQYVASSNQINGRYRLPAVYFRYEIESITVKFKEWRRPLSHFLVQVCNIFDCCRESV